MSLKVRCLICGKILECNPNDTANLVEHVKLCHPEIKLHASSTDLVNPNPDPNKNEQDPTLMNKEKKSNLKKPDTSSKLCCLKDEKTKDNSKTDLTNTNISKPKPDENLNAITPCTTNNIENIIKPIQIYEIQCGEVPLKDSNELKKKPITTNIESDPQPCKASLSKLDNTPYKRKYNIKNTSPFSKKGKERLYKTSIEKWRPGKSRICCPSCGAIRRPLIKSETEKVHAANSPLGAAFIVTCWPFCFLPCLFPPPIKEYLYCAVCDSFLGVYDRKKETIQPPATKCK